ncbi:MAG TPA: M20/M25/M40 family metallo-hydrolase [Phycisphaerales bacterium]|nr:M20/M25/M40 family metallo-hydrolase [Phycisphaerales bacterium]HMP38497.1 M20/M25/M40 family metallo-hydrolase [Phycisphaerales bacterium]
MSLDTAKVIAHADREFGVSVERLKEFLRIPSVSTDPEYDAETRRAGQWVVDELRQIGFNAELRETIGHPMVVATHDGPKGSDAPRALYYGHYDVQPADPLELWESGPFDPIIQPSDHGEKIVARGAVDDKGQVMTFIEAFRAWHETHGTMPTPITVLIEGEEESGSRSLEPFLRDHARELAAAVAVVSDTGMWDIDTPAITSMLRGLVYIEAILHGPSRDLHSGVYGGTLMNPCNGLVEVLGELHDRNGRVAIPGFYDEVRELDAGRRRAWEALRFDERSFLAGVGMKTPFGEPGRTTLERMWSRPTCDINGISGGYTGKGAKTVIGSFAAAKISCRLVPDQDPATIREALQRFLEERTPVDGRWEFHQHGCSPAIEVPTDSMHLKAAARGLERIYGKAPILMGSGGSIPAVGSMQRILGIDSLLVGFGLEDDRVHSPNEKFELTCYRRGIHAHAAILAELAGARP